MGNPTKEEIDALCAHFEAEGYEAIDPHTARYALIASHAARPVPESARDLFEEIRTGLYDVRNSPASERFKEYDRLRALIQSAIDAARAEDRAENAWLRAVVSKCADALGNGAFISPDCTVEFMESLPSEIGLHVASLVEDRDTWKERADAATAQAAKMREALCELIAAVAETYRDRPMTARVSHAMEAARAAVKEDGK